jgi:hypothetical protein
MSEKLPFRLYPEEQRWWSAQDYQAVLDAMKQTGARRCIEFGPGSSTLALVEGGAETVDTCEDSPDWADVYRTRLADRFPEQVRLHLYAWPLGSPLSIEGLDAQRWDLALIDGPLGTERRPDVLRYCLARCRWVLMPTEDHHSAPWLRPRIAEIAQAAGVPVDVRETGPLSGGFALVGPTC